MALFCRISNPLWSYPWLGQPRQRQCAFSSLFRLGIWMNIAPVNHGVRLSYSSHKQCYQCGILLLPWPWSTGITCITILATVQINRKLQETGNRMRVPWFLITGHSTCSEPWKWWQHWKSNRHTSGLLPLHLLWLSGWQLRTSNKASAGRFGALTHHRQAWTRQ